MKMTCRSLLQVAVLLLFGTLRAKQRSRQKAPTSALKPATGIASLRTYLFMPRTWDALGPLKRTLLNESRGSSPVTIERFAKKRQKPRTLRRVP